MVSAQKIAPAQQETDYSKYVQNTIDLRKRIDVCKTDAEKASLVREFFELGGLRTGYKIVSPRKHASVFCIPEDLTLQVGTKVSKSKGSQKTIPDTVTIKAGTLVEFEYNTEKGAALTILNNKDDVVRISLGGDYAKPITLDPLANADAVNFFLKAIQKTSELYSRDKAFATFMEQTVDALYGVGHKGSKGIHMATMQSKMGLMALKSAVRGKAPVYGPLGRAKDQTISEWAGMVYEMVNPKSTVGVLDSFIPDKYGQREEIIRELKLEDDEVSNFYVGFTVKNGRLAVNMFSYMDLKDEETKFKPVLMYQIQHGGQGPNVSFDNDFQVERSFNIKDDYRKDYDNTRIPEEKPLEAYLTKSYNEKERNVYDRQINVIALNIVMPDAEFDMFTQSFNKEFKQLSK
jgi:hypothetical protein